LTNEDAKKMLSRLMRHQNQKRKESEGLKPKIQLCRKINP
jgi:hypothetical protein